MFFPRILPCDKVKLAFINLVINMLGISYENLFTQAFPGRKRGTKPKQQNRSQHLLTPSLRSRDLKGKNPRLQIYFDTKSF